MASSRAIFHLFVVLSYATLFFVPNQSTAYPLNICGFDSIYQLGDSMADTGNLIRESIMGAALPFARLPYGETFFKNATGRCSNGLLMIDYIAQASGLPLLNPYKNNNADFSHGVNFAVAGSTALSTEALAAKNISSGPTNSSLNIQLDWMTGHFNSICSTSRDCVEKLKSSLFMVGEIGGNDYNYAFFQGKSMDEIRSLVPNVVQAIKEAVRKVIDHGAVRVVVPGNFPIGCFPIYLSGFQTNESAAYDEHQCLKFLNDFSKYHNDHLQQGIQELKMEFPDAAIVYGDYYNAFLWLLRHAPYVGFDGKSIQKSCCGTGGDYNFSFAKMCGAPGVPICENPNKYISWDGVHLTQLSYMYMAGWLEHNILSQLHCSHS